MRLGGWSRLGVVLSFLYATLVFVVAYDSRPTLDEFEKAWFDEAAEAIAGAISKAEGVNLTPDDTRKIFMKKGRVETVSWLEKIAAFPTDNQKIFSGPVAQINKKYKAIISNLPIRIREHWLLAFAYWAGGTFLLFGAGCTVRWIYRGFRSNSA